MGQRVFLKCLVDLMGHALVMYNCWSDYPNFLLDSYVTEFVELHWEDRVSGSYVLYMIFCPSKIWHGFFFSRLESLNVLKGNVAFLRM